MQPHHVDHQKARASMCVCEGKDLPAEGGWLWLELRPGAWSLLLLLEGQVSMSAVV